MLDTPYIEQNIYQNFIQTYLDITLKDQYPFRVYLTNRFSNSNYFRDCWEVNFQFNHADFKQKIKENLKNQLQKNVVKSNDYSLLEKQLLIKLKEIN